MSQTAKIVRKFCQKTLIPYKPTLQEVRRMTPDERGARLKAMREFIANIHIALPNQPWSPENEKNL